MERFRQFLHLDGKVPKGGSFYTEDEDDGSCHGSESTQWSGAFKFNLAVLSSHTPIWYLGTNQLSQENDILLAPQSRHWTKLRIARKHAQLYLHHESYRFMLEACHSITIGKNGAKVLTRSKSHVVEHEELILIGTCCYVFEYTDFSKTTDFERDLSRFVKEHFGSQSLNRHLSPTSIGDPILLGDYYCSPSAFAQGTFGRVTAGWASDGAAVAIKTFKNPKQFEIELHKNIMRSIGTHENILQLLDCVSHFNVPVPDAYCVYAPLAVASLSDVINSYEADIDAQVTLLGSYSSGLSYLHNEKGIMHGDISPNNLAIISFDPPQGMIIDLDSATRSQSSTEHLKGTIAYLAPEILALKLGDSKTPFEKSVDVWALGLSMFCLQRRELLQWGQFSREREKRVKNGVNKPCYEGFRRKLGEMQTIFPADRLFFFVALEDMVAWEPVKRSSLDKVHNAVSASAKRLPKGRIAARRVPKRCLED